MILDHPSYAMLCIQALDANASLKFSSETRQWYVDAEIFEHDGRGFGNFVHHEDDPGQAVLAFFHNIIRIESPKALVTHALTGAESEQKYYRWNGAHFVEVHRPTPPKE